MSTKTETPEFRGRLGWDDGTTILQAISASESRLLSIHGAKTLHISKEDAYGLVGTPEIEWSWFADSRTMVLIVKCYECRRRREDIERRWQERLAREAEAETHETRRGLRRFLPNWR